MSTDTHPAIAARQIELLRDAGPVRRFAIARSLTRAVVALSRRALRGRRPGAGEAELDREFVRLHYGEDVARLLPRRVRSAGAGSRRAVAARQADGGERRYSDFASTSSSSFFL